MEYIIDRFESDNAVLECEDESHIIIEKSLIDGDPKEGDCLVIEQDRYVVDTVRTEILRREVLELQRKLLNKSK